MNLLLVIILECYVTEERAAHAREKEENEERAGTDLYTTG
jgi:hypothetical protein